MSDAIDRSLVVGKILPAAGKVAKSVEGNALEFGVAAAAICRGKDFDVESGGPLAPKQLDQPGRDDVPGRARKCRNHMKDAH